MTELPPGAADQLDRDGYYVFRNLLDGATIERLRRLFDGDASSGTLHVPDLEKREETRGIHDHPLVLAAVHHILRREFVVQHFAGRAPLPGFGQQGLHTDWYTAAPDGHYVAATALWLLDDFTRTNGATRIVPGTHRLAKPLPKNLQQPLAHHPGEELVIARAGSALVLNGHLWHSGTKNESSVQRRVLQCQYVIHGAQSLAGGGQ